MSLLLKDPDAVLDYLVDWGVEYLDVDNLTESAWSVASDITISWRQPSACVSSPCKSTTSRCKSTGPRSSRPSFPNWSIDCVRLFAVSSEASKSLDARTSFGLSRKLSAAV